MGLRFLSAEFQWKLLDALVVSYPKALPLEVYQQDFAWEPEIKVLTNIRHLIDSNLMCAEAIAAVASGLKLNVSQLLLTDIGYFLAMSSYL